MAMTKFTVNTTLKLFIAKAGVTSFDVQKDLYADGKQEWLLGGVETGFDFPIRTVAGDPRSDGSIIEPFYFLRDGWKLRADEADHTLNITGNVELDTGETGQLFVPTLGGFTALVVINTTNRGTLVTAAGTADWTTSEKEQIRHRLGLDGSKLAPASVEAFVNLAKAGDAMTLLPAERTVLVTAILDLADSVESGYSVRMTLRLIAAVLLGKSTGGPANTVFRSMDDGADRVATVADNKGDRSSVTLTP